MKSTRVSFDFDKTLEYEEIQLYAKELIDSGIEVYIVTSRYDDTLSKNNKKNEDLYKVADILNINKNNIIFTNMAFKYEILNKYDFVWHLDDSVEEVALINSNTKVNAILYNRNYKSKCNNFLNI